MTDSQKDVHQPHDKGYKFLLSSKKVFIQLLRSFVNQDWVDQVDKTQLIRVDKSYILQDFQDKEADLVYRMKMKDQEVIFYVLMELQSSVDFQMPYRLLLYMTEIWRGLLKDTAKQEVSRKDFKLPVIVPIVVYNGKNNWTANIHFKEMLNGYERFGDNVLDFKYTLIDVNRYRKEELLELSNLIGAVFLLDQSMENSELWQRLVELIDVIQKLSHEELELFYAWMKGILTQKGQIQVIQLFDKTDRKEGAEMISNLEETLKKMQEEAAEKAAEKATEKEKKETAKRMLKKGYSLDLIAEVTCLTIKKVEELKGERKNEI